MMHKDLSDEWREVVDADAGQLVMATHHHGQSLAIAREAWINAFDEAAEELCNEHRP